MLKTSINFCKTYFTGKKLKFSLAYLILGCFLYLLNGMYISYFNFIYYSTIHPYLITFFLIPVIYSYTYMIQKDIDNNRTITLFFKNKNHFQRFSLLNIIYVSTIWFLIYMFIIFVMANLFAARTDLIGPDPNYEETLNIIGMIFAIAKLYMFMSCYSLLFYAFNRLLGKYKTVGISIIVFSLFTMLGYIDFGSIINIFLPYKYIGVSYIYDTFNQYVTQSSIYIVVLMAISILLFRMSYKKKEI